METEDFVVMDIGDTLGIDVGGSRQDVHLLAVMVNIDNDSIILTDFW